MALATGSRCAVVVALGLLLAGCGSSSTAGPPPATLTENDFATDPGLSIAPRQSGLTVLEAVDAAASDAPDTGTRGVDEIPFTVEAAETRTYAMDPEDASGTVARIEVLDPAGAVVLSLAPGAPRASVALLPGRHVLRLHSGYTVAGGETGAGRAVFVFAPRQAAPVGAATAGGIARVEPACGYWCMVWMVSARRCDWCDLSHANLAGLSLSGTDLSRKDLTGANLTGTWLVGADLIEANLGEAALVSATLTRAKLTGATLRFAMLAGARLEGANLARAYLYGANLTAANLTGANLGDADLTRAVLDSAVWTDGRVCAPPSTGTCR